MEFKDPRRYIPIIFLLYSWGSLFAVPNEVPLYFEGVICCFVTGALQVLHYTCECSDSYLTIMKVLSRYGRFSTHAHIIFNKNPI